jgi:hypothetical protein
MITEQILLKASYRIKTLRDFQYKHLHSKKTQLLLISGLWMETIDLSTILDRNKEIKKFLSLFSMQALERWILTLNKHFLQMTLFSNPSHPIKHRIQWNLKELT